jgi:hypothetical protein
MLQDNAAEPETDPPRRRRLRFGLKTLFIILTALCLWLGYHVVREHRADEILARHDAVLAVLVKQIATAPAQTFYSISPGSEDEVLHRLGYPDRRFRRATLLRVDHSGSTTSQSLAIDVSKLLAINTNPTTIADQLAQHYLGALVPLGFQHTYTHGDTRSEFESKTGTYHGIWSSPNWPRSSR